MKIAREAWPFAAPVAALAIVLASLHRPGWAAAAATAALATAAFFRIPARRPSAPPDTLLSAANGVVTAVEPCTAPEVGPGPYLRIVTFLSVFDVHVQRAPCAGTVLSVERTRGRKVAAFRRDAGEVNERCLTVLEADGGERIGVVQIAGLVARRVVPWCRPGDVCERADLIGLIRFGSRVDVLLPADYEVLVSQKDRVREGLTPIARRMER